MSAGVRLPSADDTAGYAALQQESLISELVTGTPRGQNFSSISLPKRNPGSDQHRRSARRRRVLSLHPLVLIEFSSVLHANHTVFLRIPHLEFLKSELLSPRYEVRSVCATAVAVYLSPPSLCATPSAQACASVFAPNSAAISFLIPCALFFFWGGIGVGSFFPCEKFSFVLFLIFVADYVTRLWPSLLLVL